MEMAIDEPSVKAEPGTLDESKNITMEARLEERSTKDWKKLSSTKTPYKNRLSNSHLLRNRTPF